MLANILLCLTYIVTWGEASQSLPLTPQWVMIIFPFVFVNPKTFGSFLSYEMHYREPARQTAICISY